MLRPVILILCVLLLTGCKENTSQQTIETAHRTTDIKYAEGFQLSQKDSYTELTLTRPWPGAERTFTYALVPEGQSLPDDISFDAVVHVPIRSIVVTSTTHIPSLEMLEEAESLMGFPNLNYISSEHTRSLIDAGKVRELGQNESLNTEVLIDMNPNAVVTFAVEGANKTVTTLQNAGIPVLYNADWTETHPLGKAEWIKFFGALFQKETLAQEVFDSIETQYNEAKELASTATNRPTVLSGAMFKDVWYLPQGDSWAAQFLKDAKAHYLWKDTEGVGSLSLNLESVLEKAQAADFWIGPGQFTSLSQLEEAHSVYTQFDAYQNTKIFTFTSKKGETGGVLYYELAPNRPDLVLRDIIKILHPDLLPQHQMVFFEALSE